MLEMIGSEIEKSVPQRQAWPMNSDIIVVTPVFNDWDSFRVLVRELSDIAAEHDLSIRILAVDDGSSIADKDLPLDAQHLRSVEVVRLACNLGHQRAIAIGLVEAHKFQNARGVVVMDCDGEDRPSDIPRMLEAAAKESNVAVVAATRSRRSEGLAFRSFYKIYKNLFRTLIGQQIDFGNFVYIPKPLLVPLIHSAGIWNHLAASLCRSRLRLVRLPTARGSRYAGQSKMNFSSLVVHGLGAMSVYVDVLLARLLTFISGFIALLLLAICSVLVVRFFTDLAIPGWATNAIGFLGILLIQSLIFVVISVFIVLNLRTMKTVVPIFSSQEYLEKRYTLFSRARTVAAALELESLGSSLADGGRP